MRFTQNMAVNRDKPDRWKRDIAQSVDMYNDWFMHFAPKLIGRRVYKRPKM